MRKIKKSTVKSRTSPKWCPECGFHVRGPNHTDGIHHKTATAERGIQGRTGEKTRRRKQR